MTETTNLERETTAAARRRVDAADRARRWRVEQRQAEAARLAELDALRAEVENLRVERDRLRADARVDEEVLRALTRLARCRLHPDGRMTYRWDIAFKDLRTVAAWGLLDRARDEPVGRDAFVAAQSRVHDRLARFALPAKLGDDAAA